jgi:preprotein translocase subunit SecB|tara:strand:- start:53 stop:475 length:423 start_codon:yes stop_codon:yes gene_type:complete
MSKKYKILSSFIKDMSSETPNVESYLFTKDNISKYELDIDINSNPLKNKLIEVNTCLKFNNKTKQEKKSYFEVIYTSIVRIEDGVKEKKDLQKIILCDVPTEIYEKIEKILLNILSDSGYPGVKFDKKINFNKLFTEKFN